MRPPVAARGVDERIALLSAETTFAFSSAELTPLGLHTLDARIARVGALDGIEAIEIVGDADPGRRPRESRTDLCL
ncbi:hypothetical protein MNO14_03210 [Luteimonas sp. S4-F44]|uniref:hypothetical protein n=1 Tax=Luteimonas sp. S4-F44 TaxID=2925842 RepID=UPI001F539A8F|nr:hypothetical protein [Luteimonas sp. S4-F44]UNK43120.1 hypothetical protein MNO14_03210 [Luteimonas sp. S4-F44]